MLVTDLNSRERARYASLAKEVSATAESLAECLTNSDDSKAVVQLAVCALTMNQLHGLVDIFAAAINVQIPERP